MKFLCPNCKAKYRIGPEKLVGRQVAKIRCRKCDYRIQLTPRPGSDEYDITATPTSIAPPASGAPKSSVAARAAVALEAPSARPLPLPRPRADGGEREEPQPPATKKPTAAVPGLPGLGTSKIARGVAGRDAGAGASLARRAGSLPSGPSPQAGLSPGRLPSIGLPPVPLPPPPSAVPGLSASVGGPATAVFPPIAAPAAAAAVVSEPRFEAAVPFSTPPLPPNPAVQAVAPPPGPAPVRPGTGGTQLADQFRQSVQAGGSGNAADEGPQDGWFVGVNGVPLGPIPVGDLKELAAAGHVDRRSLVWREGQAEWRPLGKFPQLARLLEDSGIASVSQARPAAVATPRDAEPSHSNGAAASPSATGFDMRPASSPEAQRPSAWGDLDEEDDEEQPTTVKGRVSGLPPIPAPNPGSPGASSVTPFVNESSVGAGPPVAFDGAAGNTSGLARAADVAGAPIAAPSSASMGISPAASLPVELASGELEAGRLRGSGRGRIYAFVIVAVASLALGWTLRHVLWSGSDSEPVKPPSSVPAHSQSAPLPAEQPTQAARAPKLADEVSTEPGGGDHQAGAGPARAADQGAMRISGESSRSKAALVPPALTSVAGISHESAKPAGSASTSDPGASRSSTGSLLSSLGTAQAPVVAGPHGSADARASSGSLDAAAIQRVVRRYAPAVKQSCWQRALSARAPGVPSSAKVTATITVDATGHVSLVSAAGAPRGYPGLAHCIEDAVQTWQFPRAAGETTTTVPFMFVGQ